MTAGRRFRILLVEPALGDNGALRGSLERAFRWAGSCEVTLLVVDRQSNEVDPPPGLKVVVANEKGLRRRILEGKPMQRIFGRRRPAAAVDRALAEFSIAVRLVVAVARAVSIARKADVVVAGREIEGGLLVGAMAASIARRPFTVTGRSNFAAALNHHVPPHYVRATCWATRQAVAIVCVSGDVPDTYRDVRLPRSSFHVVSGGLDASDIRRRASDAPAVELGDLPVLVAVGRLGEAKGFDVLIRAHAVALAAGAPRHEVWIIGRGPLHDELAKLASVLGVGDSVRLLGFLTNPHAIVSRSAGFVLSSRWEGLPRVLIEALALGVPCIATDCIAGPREVLGSGRWGRLVAPEDPAALARAIGDHLRRPDVLRRSALLGMDQAAERYDVDDAARRHLDVLCSVARPAAAWDQAS